jgi:nucleotide-binding universal stress UspA family protein
MFARVLFPTDFSSYADSVLACLPDLMSAGLREVILLSVNRPSDVPMPGTVNRDSLEYWRWSLEEKLNIAKMALEGKGLRVLTRVEYGNPVEQIVSVAEDELVEMIVLGGRRALSAYQGKQVFWRVLMQLNALSAEPKAERGGLQNAFVNQPVVQEYFKTLTEFATLCQTLGGTLFESIGLNYAAACGVSCCG